MVKALVASGPGGELAVEDVDLPEPGPGQAQVAVRAAGVCHSDLSMINGTVTPDFPLILGHEAAGVVMATGPGVSRVNQGDHVVINGSPACRECCFRRPVDRWLRVPAPGVPA